MLAEMIGFFLGLAVGFLVAKDRYQELWSPLGQLLTYKTAKGDIKLGRLAQRFCEKDEMAIVDAVNESNKFLPFVIGRDNIRFFTNDGKPITVENWKDSE